MDRSQTRRRLTPLERFKAKCEFMPASGCVLWRGGCSTNSAGDTKRPVFRDGKRWSARRWAAAHVHGHDVQDWQITVNTCGDDLCVQHVSTIDPPYNVRQHWLLIDYGYEDREPEEHRLAQRPNHDGPPRHDPPGWLS
jgi:hypothetical protein